MKRHVMSAILVGLLTSGVLYYVWCSLQWRHAAEARSTVTATPSGPASPGPGAVVVTPPTAQPAAQWRQDGPVSFLARIGHPYTPAMTASSTHIALTASTGSALGRNVRVPANVVLVIDRSGSMQGARITHAQAAAEYVLDNLQDGDHVAVVTYASSATVDVPSMIVSPDSRARARAVIRNIWVGGGTCVSCGIESGDAQLFAAADDGARRLILLSDGQANQGIVGVDDLATMAKGIERRGAVVSSIGVGLDYNEELMSQVAISGNGTHHFVEDPALLASILESELSTLRSLVARRVTVSFELAPGVRFVKGYDRDFQVVGNQVIVSLGDMAASAERTSLFEVSMPATPVGRQPVADLRIAYEDVETMKPTAAVGALAVVATTDAATVQRETDAEVAARVEQAALSEALDLANAQLQRGEYDQAERTMQNSLQRASTVNASLGNAKLDSQIKAFEGAADSVAAPAARTKDGGSRAAKGNAVLKRKLAY